MTTVTGWAGLLAAVVMLGGWTGADQRQAGGAGLGPDTLQVDPRPVGREAVEALTYPPLRLDPPEAGEYRVLDVPVYHLHDPSLPLVDVFVQMEGGSAHFSRDELGPIAGFATFLRYGGTRELPPDSVDRKVDLLALQLGFGSAGSGRSATLNSLPATLDDGLELLSAMLTRPGFDREVVEVWRGQELERVRRRADNPTSLAYDEFNRLMFGDHSVGWVLQEEDLAPEHFTDERLRSLQDRLLCRERLVLGVVGDLTWEEAEPRIERFLADWPPCARELPEPPAPEMRTGGGIYILPREVEQTTIIMAKPGGVRQEASSDYYASRVANRILGGGGFSSRLMTRIRTEEGLTYGASSIWTTPLRYEGLVGAVTSTRPERTLDAVGLTLEVLDDFRSRPPDDDEVARAVEEISNGYVFAFQSTRQIVARRMGDLAQGLPEDWLERYFAGIQAVDPADVHRVARRWIVPDEMTILLVGDPARFGPGINELGPLYRLGLDGSIEPWDAPPP